VVGAFSDDHAATMQRARDAFALREFEVCMRAAEAALSQRRDDADALLLLANAAIGARDWNRAVPALEQLLARMPQNATLRHALATALNNRGAAARRSGRITAANADFDAALTIESMHREALLNRAEAWLDARRPDEASALLLRSAADTVDTVLLRARAAALRSDAGQVAALRTELDSLHRAAALDPLRAAAALARLGEPSHAAALPRAQLQAATPIDLVELGTALRDSGYATKAREVFRTAALHAQATAAPALAARIASALSLPPVYANGAEISAERAQLRRGLDQLLEWSESPAASVGESLDALAFDFGRVSYQGRDDLDLQRGWGRFLDRMAQRIEADLTHDLALPQRSRRRIVVLSSGLRYCSTGSWFGPWIGALSDDGFEVIAAQLGPTFDLVTEAIGSRAAALLRLDGSLADIARQVRALAADLVLLPEVGADPRMAVLASLHLAPRMIAAWGHPATSGLPRVTHFLTPAVMEPDGAEAHYSEQLLRLPGIGVEFGWRPELAPPPAGDEAGLPAGHRYFVPQMAQKWHPDQDIVFAQLAARDPEARLIGFRGDAWAATERVRTRVSAAIAAAGGDPARQLLLLDPVPRPRFLEIAGACHVMIDSLHWSGGTASLDALAAGLPIVTCPGALMRGRQSYGMLKLLGLDTELAVVDPDGMVERAFAIASEPDRRALLSRTMAERLPLLYDAAPALRALTQRIAEIL
jgi:CRISPR-associated protein Csy1